MRAFFVFGSRKISEKLEFLDLFNRVGCSLAKVE